MKTSTQTLIEQLKITKREIERRKAYFLFTAEDNEPLATLRQSISENIEDIVKAFYDKILLFPEMDRIIGDAETLRKLKNHQRNYILSLFDGQYDEDYVLSRLRVGIVHRRGDEILIAVARVMTSSLREPDISARYGGDEFCVVLPESSLQEAIQVCNKLWEGIKKSTEGSGISCSMGIAVSSPEKHYDANSLVKEADKAMYEAKKEPGFVIKVA